MVRATLGDWLARVRQWPARLREWWGVDDPEERIEGSGEVHLDPAYNGRYTAERELQRLAAADEESDGAHDDPE